MKPHTDTDWIHTVLKDEENKYRPSRKKLLIRMVIVFIVFFLLGMYSKPILKFLFSNSPDPHGKSNTTVKKSDTLTAHVFVNDRLYVPESNKQSEQFILILTDRQGYTFTINDNKLWSKADKGDSVIVAFTRVLGSNVYRNIEKIKSR